MAQLTPYLGFNGNCREAMTFYKNVFGGELILNTVAESPEAAAHMPLEAKDSIMHSQLKNEHITLMASDMMGDQPNSERITLCIVGNSKEETERLFNDLSQGGNVTEPLKEVFFGTFGKLTDKFGINWMFQFGTGEK